MEIDFNAPVAAASQIEIAADAATIWDTLANVERWPEWNADVKAVALDGPVDVGSVFRWKTSAGTITSTFKALARPREIGWVGRTLGITARHVWRLEPAEGRTIVRTSESFNGVLVRLFRFVFQRMLEETLDRGVVTLRTAVEARYRRPRH
jgi:hypothetical protein